MDAEADKGETFSAYLEIGSSEGKPFRIDANLIATGRTCIIGSSGSGKSYAVAVMCEELCKNKVPFAILDTEGEYAGLKEKYEMILISEGENSDLTWKNVDLREVAEQATEIAPLIFDLSEVDSPMEKVSKFLQELYRSLSARRLPYLLIVEEADRFVPQAGKRIEVIGEIARRGRKRGIGLMVCTQRPSLVDKNILSQCGNQLIGKLVIQNDLQSVSQFFGSKGIPKQLTSLAPGNFYAIGGFAPSPILVTIRKRETRHIGATPLLKDRVVKPFMGTLSSMVATMKSEDKELDKQEKGSLIQGLKPLIEEKQVPFLLKRRREHILFGEEEKVVSLALVWKKLHQAALILREGILMKRFRTKYLLFDPEYRSLVSGLEPLRYDANSKKIWGLSQKLITVLRAVDVDRRDGVVDIDAKVGFGRNSTRAVLKKLEAASLVSSFEQGRLRLYRRLVTLPQLKLSDEPVAVEEMNIMPEGVAQKPDTKDVREVVKALIPGSDVGEIDLFYYPLFKVELILKGHRRLLYLDARTGDKVSIP